MNFTNLLKRDIGTISFRETIRVFLIIFAPNFIFLFVAFFTATSRPLINIDYLFALLFLFFPWRFMRLIGVLVLVSSILFDMLMFIIQIFPFIDFAAIRYLSSFISIAPITYLLTCILFIFFTCLILSSVIFLARNQNKKIYAIFITFIFTIVSLVFMHLRVNYAEFNGILGRDNYFIAHSQIKLYQELKQDAFWSDSNVTPRLGQLKKDKSNASSQLNKPYSPKILYVISESWGSLKDSDANNLILKNIIAQKNNFEFINIGSFYTTGATVAGELRELCNMELMNNGFAFSRLDRSVFSNCLPNKLLGKGYKTIALHGSNGVLYDRKDWYRNAGFREVFFGENFIGLPRCRAFNGICDKVLFDIVADSFKKDINNSLFFYWITLSSHHPYSAEDIYDRRFICEKFKMNSDGEICRNTHLQTQFFDSLAELIKKPQMKGVEVVVVGDHQPPFFGHDIEHVFPLTVSYLHFKIK